MWNDAADTREKFYGYSRTARACAQHARATTVTRTLYTYIYNFTSHTQIFIYESNYAPRFHRAEGLYTCVHAHIYTRETLINIPISWAKWAESDRINVRFRKIRVYYVHPGTRMDLCRYAGTDCCNRYLLVIFPQVVKRIRTQFTVVATASFDWK